MKNMLLHDDFIDQARHYIQDITALRNSGNAVEAAKKNLEFAKFKVAYYASGPIYSAFSLSALGSW